MKYNGVHGQFHFTYSQTCMRICDYQMLHDHIYSKNDSKFYKHIILELK